MKTWPYKQEQQRGVAVITALLLTTLAITIVASLFWQQQVQVRSIENQRAQLQKQWILRGALDWAALILRVDAQGSNNDNLDEAWAVPLAETPLDQYVEKGRTDADAPDAALSGNIIDAQSRYNITNLLNENGDINTSEVDVLAKLLSLLGISPNLAQETANFMKGTSQSATEENTNAPKLMPITQVEDLLAVPGFNLDMLAKLKNNVVVLPKVTRINVNTASAEVLAARIDGITLQEALAIVTSRKKAYFLSLADLSHRLAGKTLTLNEKEVSLKTHYFFINGNVRLNRATLQVQALVERASDNEVKVVWLREN
jgi:general secretion pathway protein K